MLVSSVVQVNCVNFCLLLLFGCFGKGIRQTLLHVIVVLGRLVDHLNEQRTETG